MKTSGALDGLHDWLSQKFKSRLGDERVTIVGAEKKWKEASASSRSPAKISFRFCDVDCSERVTRERGEAQVVFALCRCPEDQKCLWFGWYDEWKKVGADSYLFVGASMSFYLGYAGRDKTQILRAEWDSTAIRASNAAQPHWHVDTQLMVDFESRSFLPIQRDDRYQVVTEGGLEELMPSQAENVLEELGASANERSVQDLNMSGMHLGMGGWRNSSSHPACWQCPIEDHAQLIDWADFTLASVCDQFVRVRFGAEF